MRTSFAKITWLFLLLLCLSIGFMFFAQAQTNKLPKKVNDSDTTKHEKEEFPFEAEEISISEDRIYIRTREGKEYLVSPEGKIHIPTGEAKRHILRDDDLVEAIIIDDDKIRIGDIEIDLEDLEDIEDIEDLEDLEALEGLEGLKALVGLRGLEGLKALKNSEALQEVLLGIRTPRVQVSPRVYTTSEGIVKFGSDVVVEEDEEIDGDVVALGGTIEVRGTVTGNVVAIGGDVDIFSTGDVEGDAVSIGGQVIKRGGAVVRGEKVSVGRFGAPSFKLPFTHPPFPMFTHIGFPAFILRIFKILFFIFLGVVVLAILPKNVDKVKEKVKHDLLKSGLVGLLAEILVIPIFILLIITIIGIPVALLVQPLLILAAVILGYTGTCLFVGEKLQEHTSLKPDTKIMILVMGILAVELVPLVARTIGVFGGIFSPFALIISIIGWIIGYVVITIGFGAAILSRLGTRPKDVSPAPAAANVAKSDSDEKTST